MDVVQDGLTFSVPKANLTKPRKLLNPELSNETWRCDHSNESSRWVLSNGGVRIVAEQSSCFCKFYLLIWTEKHSSEKDCRRHFVTIVLPKDNGLKPWLNGIAIKSKSMQDCKTRTYDGWLKVFVSWLASSRNWQKVVNFMLIQFTCDQLVSIWVGWPNGERLASTCVRIWARPKSLQVGGQTKRKLNASRKLALTWVNLRVHLARALKKRDFGDMMKLSEPKMKAIIVNYLETWKSSRHKIRKDDSLPICVASETLTE